jgi:uncharacterized protein (PEP-CTERM system associated)
MHRREVAAPSGEPRRPQERVANRCGRVLCVCAASVLGNAMWLGSAHAEKWSLLPAFDTRVNWTDNSSFDGQGQTQGDTIFELIPSLGLRGEGRRFRITGTISLDALAYLNHTRSNRVLPTVDLTANLEAIEQYFFIEAGVVARQEADDVFAPRPNSGSDFNTVTSTQYRVVPTFQSHLGSDVDLRLKSFNSWFQVGGGTSEAGGAYLGEHTLTIERKPAPLGWTFEAERSATRFESSLVPSGITDSVRLGPRYAVTPNFTVGLHGGYEKTTLVVTDQEQVIYGADLQWRPSERTDLSGLWEERFFGASWHATFTHRMPRVAWTIGFSRDVETLPQSFLTLPPTNNVAGLLDSALTTRIPDAAERSRVVSELIARQGLPSSLASETTLFSQQVSIVTARSASIAFIGVRNTVALSVFSSRNDPLPDSIYSLITPAQNVIQDGATFSASHQATPATSWNLTAGSTRVRGIGTSEGSDSTQSFARLVMSVELSAKSSAYAGARVQHFTSTTAGQPNTAREHGAFVGLSHRF